MAVRITVVVQRDSKVAERRLIIMLTPTIVTEQPATRHVLPCPPTLNITAARHRDVRAPFNAQEYRGPEPTILEPFQALRQKIEGDCPHQPDASSRSIHRKIGGAGVPPTFTYGD